MHIITFQIPLGIQLKSETSYETMLDIMKNLHQYVPVVEMVGTTIDTTDGHTKQCKTEMLHYTLLGGDQLTVSRAKGCQRIRCDSIMPSERLKGLQPVIEDWHAKGVFLEVGTMIMQFDTFFTYTFLLFQCVWKGLYSTASVSDGGTMYHLRNLINRRNVTSDPSHNVDPSEDFFITIVEAYILNAAMDLYQMKSLSDDPVDPSLFSNIDYNKSEKREALLKASEKVISKFVDISLETKIQRTSDGIYSYTCEVISLGLLLLEFNDAVHEGDGERILRCWKFFFPIFKASKRKNYAIEAFNLLYQYYFLFTPRMAAQLLWNRTVNTRGGLGKNIPCDLHMEHLNRCVKTAMSSLSSNISDESVIPVGKCIRPLSEIMSQFDYVHHIPSESYSHPLKSRQSDIEKIIEQLQSSCVTKLCSNRQHKGYPNFESNMIVALDKVKLYAWMNQQIDKKIQGHDDVHNSL